MGGKKIFYSNIIFLSYIFQVFTDDEKGVWKQKAIEFRKTPEYTKLKLQHKLRNPGPRRRKKSVSIDSDDDFWEISSKDDN